jgi:hypothetical protein
LLWESLVEDRSFIVVNFSLKDKCGGGISRSFDFIEATFHVLHSPFHIVLSMVGANALGVCSNMEDAGQQVAFVRICTYHAETIHEEKLSAPVDTLTTTLKQ